MNSRTKLGLKVLEAALLLGVLGDALLRETPWGLNVFLWTGALVAAMYALHARGEGRASWRADGGWLFLPLLFFAAAFAWRDSPTLNFLDGLALFFSLALLAWRARGRSIRLAGLTDYVLGLGHAAFDALFASLPLVFTDVQWGTIPRGGAMRHVWAVVRGLVIAVPLLFIFGALLMAADAVFEGIMERTFQFDSGALFSHIFLMLLFAWMAGGFLRGMSLGEATTTAASVPVAPPAPASAPFVPTTYTSITIDDRKDAGADAPRVDEPGGHRQPPESVVVEGGAVASADGKSVEDAVHARVEEESQVKSGGTSQGVREVETQQSGESVRAEYGASAPSQTSEPPVFAAQEAVRGFSLGAVEVGVVLGLLNLLFASFVVVQFRYFFGGAERVMSITELTYSEYARRGFFELTWVAGLVLPLLLGAHALLRRDSAVSARIFRLLAGAQIGLLFVIMASAIARMRLYQSEYGLTELRVYTTAFMLWLGLVFVWFGWTVLVRNSRQRFACGALVAAFVTVGILHLVNPDAYIVRANAAHARAGRSFDAVYAASLSADAVPALISTLPALSRNERCAAAREISQRWTQTMFDEDWRGWNLARWRARRAVQTHRDALSEANCPSPFTSNTPDTTSTVVSTSTDTTEPPPPPRPLAPTNAPPTATADSARSATSADTSAATNSNKVAAPNNAAPATTPDNATMRMITETGAAATGVSGTRQAARQDKRRTKRHERTQAARKKKTR
ncbi:MAG TPA: DUF4173 domain-containing protein [Pyrinomonadaceae bacterium]|nr:DUF4173 domain-containing protein [Pyrinomonadaceae bacterium]